MKKIYTLNDIIPFTVGFDALFDQFDRLTESNYPPYNIEKINESEYRLTFAVAGFTKEQLSVESKDGFVTVTGSKIEEEVDNAENGIKVIHRGIADRSFERNFKLEEYVEVDSVNLANGLLVVKLTKNLPDSAKPKKFDIN